VTDLALKSYEELNAEMEQLEAQIVGQKKRVRAEALKKIKELCNELGFMARILDRALAAKRKLKSK
jgi:DNA-binding protein H-NS